MSEGAQLALEAVEASVQHFVAVRDYSRLKDMAEASAVAGQVRFRYRPLQRACVCAPSMTCGRRSTTAIGSNKLSVCLEQEACRQQSAGVITANKSAGIASV